jgi:hypothetical protein
LNFSISALVWLGPGLVNLTIAINLVMLVHFSLIFCGGVGANAIVSLTHQIVFDQTHNTQAIS